MNQPNKLSYPAKQMMLCSGTWGGGYKAIDFPYVLLKGYWFRFSGFNAGDQITIINTAPGILVLQVTKTREQFQQQGWGSSRRRHDGLSYGQLLKFADDLLSSAQVFGHHALELSQKAEAAAVAA